MTKGGNDNSPERPRLQRRKGGGLVTGLPLRGLFEHSNMWGLPKGEANSAGPVSECRAQEPLVCGNGRGLPGIQHKDRVGAEKAACPAGPGLHLLTLGMEALQAPEPPPHPQNRQTKKELLAGRAGLAAGRSLHAVVS